MDFILEEEALSQNDSIFGTNQGASRFKYKKYRDKVTLRIRSVTTLKQIEKERTAWRFERHWGYRKSQFDEANLIGGFKPLIDSMIKIGLMADDSPSLFKGYYFQQKSETGQGFIRIIKLNPGEELSTALEKISETFEVTEEVLLREARKSELTKAKND
jgi:hypothetical protein